MVFICFTRFNPNIMSEVHEPKRLMRHTDETNEFLYHAVRESRRVFEQESKILDAITKALENRNSGDPDNVNQYIKIQEKKSQLDRERVQERYILLESFFTLSKVQNMTSANLKKIKEDVLP